MLFLLTSIIPGRFLKLPFFAASLKEETQNAHFVSSLSVTQVNPWVNLVDFSSPNNDGSFLWSVPGCSGCFDSVHCLSRHSTSLTTWHGHKATLAPAQTASQASEVWVTHRGTNRRLEFLCNKCFWGIWIFTCKRIKLDSYLITYIKINSDFHSRWRHKWTHFTCLHNYRKNYI